MAVRYFRMWGCWKREAKKVSWQFFVWRTCDARDAGNAEVVSTFANGCFETRVLSEINKMRSFRCDGFVSSDGQLATKIVSSWAAVHVAVGD